MSDETIVRHCSPTLAGIKTGSLFSVQCPDRRVLTDQIRAYNRILVPKGMVMLPLRFWNGRALIYVFRPDYLKKDLSQEESRQILRELGYEGIEDSGKAVSAPADVHEPAPAGAARLQAEGTHSPELGGILRRLFERMAEGDSFPHEIGLFLGYPPGDVRGFIDHKAESFRLSGIWKVYTDVEGARRMFRKIHRCEDIYMNCFDRGTPLEKLAVRKYR